MLKTNLKPVRQAGFTLVELAIVMIIIGLLIGGVLKGQELIANAQITATVSQVKGIDAATTTFRDMYNAMPGDMTGARLPSCTAAPCLIAAGGTLGNGRVDSALNAAPTAEGRGFWAQLAAADLLSGVTGADNTFGGAFPAAEIGGGFHAGFSAGSGAGLGGVSATGADLAAIRAGHYLGLNNTPNAAMANVGFLTPNQAFRVDSKMDNGAPNTGSVVAGGAAPGAAGCASAAGAAATYNEAVANSLCNLFIRFQN